MVRSPLLFQSGDRRSLLRTRLQGRLQGRRDCLHSRWIMKVRCVKLLDSRGQPTNDSPWAKIGAIYPVLCIGVVPDRARYRLFGESPTTPALFEPEMFEIVSPIVPPTWVIASTGPGAFDL